MLRFIFYYRLMTYSRKRVFKIKELSNFQKIFDDNWIIYSSNTISEWMSNFLAWKKIIFEEWFFPVSLDRENIMGIFELEKLIKLINDDNVFKYLNNWIGEKKLINVIFNNEIEVNLIKNTTFIDCTFNNLKIKSNNKDVSLLIKKWNINWELDLSDIQNINSISVLLIEKIQSLTIENLKNINSFNINVQKIVDLNIEHSFFEWKQFSINNTEITVAWFNHVHFWETQFNWVTFIQLWFYNTTFNNCIFNNTVFPMKLENNLLRTINIETKEQKDNYRQLKHVMDKNWNHTEANKFFALEMEYYGKTLKWDKKDFVNKLIHEFQYYTSRFWNSIIRSLISLLILIIISNVINFWIMHYCYNILIDWKLNFINLLNPFFGFNKWIYENLKETKIIYFGFVVYKIIYAVLVYQLIIALKRTTRR